MCSRPKPTSLPSKQKCFPVYPFLPAGSRASVSFSKRRNGHHERRPNKLAKVGTKCHPTQVVTTQEFLIPLIAALLWNSSFTQENNHDVQELWFQQDGATCHTARATIDLLKDTFDDRLISRFGPVNWPPRSCDLTPLDYFLWGYVKSLVYADKPQTLDHLEDNIRCVIADIRPQMLEKVIENWTSRLDYIRASHGSDMPEIIFKM
ncbi:DUF4817 domain-containing protein [Trichonephila clavipes]|nr:DUF4817 domain-containing protein [Trichonephila clavipes]